MEVKPEIEFLPQRKEVMHAFSDHTKFKGIFKVTDKIDLDAGLKQMVQWARDIGLRNAVRFKNIEITKNMPPSWQKIL
jgi:UDP-glucose 4-epimerase